MSLTNFNLFLQDEGTGGNRSASEFKLFADGQLVDDVPILNTFGNESYSGVYGSSWIDVSDSLTGLPVTSDYMLEFIQNQGPSGTSGVRAMEFEASGSSSVPEPASMGAVFLGSTARSGASQANLIVACRHLRCADESQRRCLAPAVTRREIESIRRSLIVW